VDPGVAKERSGRGGPGSYVPGLATSGTFHQDRERIFWDVHTGHNAIVTKLDRENYRRPIVEVPDPIGTVRLIEDALKNKPACAGLRASSSLFAPG